MPDIHDNNYNGSWEYDQELREENFLYHNEGIPDLTEEEVRETREQMRLSDKQIVSVQNPISLGTLYFDIVQKSI